ncbi:diguanylate cyclase [Aquabacterium soli]|uniref:diguanylate cyclase n=1 Tax=Aquabacterium soli TaxID=2493092 RepID=A0A426VER3_9BURK|nr:diguanylate cyclase [Aquabacterium soli]
MCVSGTTVPCPENRFVNQTRLSTAPVDHPGHRRHRDAPSRREGGSSVLPPSIDAPLPTRKGAAHPPVRGSLEDLAVRGHPWLWFPRALEAQFNEETLAVRRRFLLICCLLGMLGIWFGTTQARLAMPDITSRSLHLVDTYLGVLVACVAAVMITPRAWRRVWHFESVVFLCATGLNLIMIWAASNSRADGAYTQSAMVIGPVMFVCIAARLRFAWSLVCALVTLLGYMLAMRGHTPAQQTVIDSIIKLQVLSYAYAVVASYTLEYRERRNWVLRKLQEQHRGALQAASERLRHLSVRDPLTGLYNRRQFDGDLMAACQAAAASGEPLALLMLDVDHFKRYNDAYGHPAGDACLVRVAHVLARVAEAHGGTAARLGGEEFALVLHGRHGPGARAVAQALCEAVRAEAIEHGASATGPHVTVSVGVALATGAGGAQPQALLGTADRALYQAKDEGRDRIVLMPVDAEARPRLEQPADDAVGVDAGAPAEPAESPYLRAIDKGLWGLRFDGDLERRYRKHDLDDRRKLLGLTVMVGMVLYNLYLFISQDMFPDISATVLQTQIGLSAFLVAVAWPVYSRKRLAPMLYEGVFCGGTSLVAIVFACVLSQSRETTTLAYIICLVLVPMFSGVGARQPFRYTCVPAVITVVAVVLFFKPVGPMQEMVYSRSVLQIFNITVFTLILSYSLELGARRTWLLGQIDRLQSEALHQTTERLRCLSVQDPLTGLPNRRQFETDLLRLWREGAQDHHPVGLLIVDVDFFKLYNDGYGHPEGDRCLQRLGGVLREVAKRHACLVARLGGEEFALLLPGGTAAEAQALGQAVCQRVREAAVEHRHSRVARHVTVSIGAASLWPRRIADRHQLLKVADKALYKAKTAGRDRVSVVDEERGQAVSSRDLTGGPAASAASA